MTRLDEQYNNMIMSIKRNGEWDDGYIVRTKYADGTPAFSKSILNQKIVLQPEDVPLITTKRVPTKDPIKEILWITQVKSNNVADLRELGSTIWDNWEKEDGTIGMSYGAQAGKKVLKHGNDYIDQIDKLLYELKYNPKSRRMLTSWWSIDDLDDMALYPCVWSTQWQVWKGKLHLTINARSQDVMVGTPYNIFQYGVLHRMIANVTGYELGTMTYNIANAHYYDRHETNLASQLREDTILDKDIILTVPKKDSFYDYTHNDVQVEGLKNRPKYRYEVAI